MSALLQRINILSEESLSEALQFKGAEQKELFRLAREKRRLFFPEDAVEVRSVIEVSNICRQKCNYCAMNLCSDVQRYTIDNEGLFDIARHVYGKGRRVLLLQSGENDSQEYIDNVCRCISKIKQHLNDLAVILCLGKLGFNHYRQLRDSGADRYILKFETSNPLLYRHLKPGDSLDSRTEAIYRLLELGFEVGSGNIVGLPGQTVQDLVNDLLFVAKFTLSMVSCTVFIPGKNTACQADRAGSIDLALNFMALLRILYPSMRIPTTSSLEKVKQGGQYLGLMAGANTVTIHDGTPAELKKNYPIYSSERFVPNEEDLKRIVKQAGMEFDMTRGKLIS